MGAATADGGLPEVDPPIGGPRINTNTKQENDMTKDKSKTWGQMTPEEKGALLLAHHEGKEIEVRGVPNAVWSIVGSPCWSEGAAYRVKPEPKHETVRLLGYGTFVSVLREDYLTEVERGVAKYAITFDTLDGKPDCNSIRMEEIE